MNARPDDPAALHSPASTAAVEVQEMLRINDAQRKYYEQADGSDESEINGFATNLWRRWRGRALSVFEDSAMDESLSELQLRWLGEDLSQAKVLDLGVGDGNPLSMRLASEAKEYLAIDLSTSKIHKFEQQLRAAGIRHARVCVADVLSDDFTERDFDLVYARAVFHHFQHFDAFLGKLSARMSSQGMVVTTDDPLETWLPMKILRRAYRSFQTDADWEWPFTKDALSTIDRRFEIERIQGTYGKSKWAIPLGFIAPARARRYADKWHRKDLDTRFNLENVTSCLRVSMLLRKRPTADSRNSTQPIHAEPR